MTRTTELASDISKSLVFKPVPVTIELKQDVKERIRGRINDDIEELLVFHIEEQYLESLKPVGALTIMTDSTNYNEAKATGKWTSTAGVIVNVQHESNDTREFSRVSMSFLRQFESVDCEYQAHMSSIDGRHSDCITFYFGDKEKKDTFIRIYLSGDLKNTVEVEGKGKDRIIELFNNTIGVQSNTTYQELCTSVQAQGVLAESIREDIFLPRVR